jgi:hypothetical protein
MRRPIRPPYRGAMHVHRMRALGSSVGLALLLIGCSSSPSAPPASSAGQTIGPGPTTEPSGAATDSPETATTTPTLPVSTGPWRPAAEQDSVAGSQLLDVVWTGPQFVAAGFGLGGGGTFLRSSDGQTWKSGTSGGTSGGPEHIAAGSNGIVAVGTLDEKTASWFSADGVHWDYHLKVFPKALGSDDMVQVTDVASNGTGWLAVGRDDAACFVSCAPAPLRALVWTSTDGLDWTRLTGQAALRGGGINAIAAFDRGFVAAGDAAGRAAFWWSPDGVTWTRVADDPSFAPSSADDIVRVVGIAARDGAIVAVGMQQGKGGDSAPTVVAWRSSDGQTWSAANVENATGGQVFSVAATPTGFLATGPSGDTSCLGGIWSSTDGSAWTCEATDPAFEGFGPYAAAGAPSVEIAVGLTSFGCGEDDCPNGFPGAIWWRPIP